MASSQKAVQMSLGAVRSLSTGMTRLQAASAQGASMRGSSGAGVTLSSQLICVT